MSSKITRILYSTLATLAIAVTGPSVGHQDGLPKECQGWSAPRDPMADAACQGRWIGHSAPLEHPWSRFRGLIASSPFEHWLAAGWGQVIDPFSILAQRDRRIACRPTYRPIPS